MFGNLKLRQRILLGYFAPLLLLFASMVVVFLNMQAASQASLLLREYRAQEDGARDIAFGILGMQRSMRGYLLLKNSSSLKSYEEAEALFHTQEKLAHRIQDPQQLEILRRLMEIGGEVNEQTRQLIEMVDTGKEREAVARFRDADDFRKTRDMAGQLSQRFLIGARTLREQQQARYDEAMAAVRNSMLVGTLGAIAIALAVGWWMAAALGRQISGHAMQLAAAAQQIAATVTEHERTASQQAAAANQTSATIEELSASSRQSAEQAANAAGLAGEASRSTAEGSAATRDAITAMASLREKIGRMSAHIVGLNDQVSQIGLIAVLVRDLAGEINMLALNAAVEASRAGEHGKGFAVVASEVRKLADQSKKSAEQTTALITDIQKATQASIMMTEESSRVVGEVTTRAEQVGNLFEQLAIMVGDVSMNAQQVMLNARQQAAAFSQVVEAVASISAGTRETASGISQTKATVDQLNQSAQSLKAMA